MCFNSVKREGSFGVASDSADSVGDVDERDEEGEEDGEDGVIADVQEGEVGEEGEGEEEEEEEEFSVIHNLLWWFGTFIAYSTPSKDVRKTVPICPCPIFLMHLISSRLTFFTLRYRPLEKLTKKKICGIERVCTQVVTK